MSKAKHPIQPLVTNRNGVTRFLENKIVSALVDFSSAHGFGLNEIAKGSYSREDHQQLAQLIGYSLRGYSELGYVDDDAYNAARIMVAAGVTEEQARIAYLQTSLDDLRRSLQKPMATLFGVHPDDLARNIQNEAEDEPPAPVDRCDTCGGYGEVPTGETQRFGDLQPPEPIMMACPECDGHAPVERVEQEAVQFTVRVCDGKEQNAFEAWAKGRRMDMDVHPLHWLFLNAKTNAARSGWVGAIEYCQRVFAASQKPASPAAQDVAGLVEALTQVANADYTARHDDNDSDILQNIRAEWYELKRIARTALAAHQSGGAK